MRTKQLLTLLVLLPTLAIPAFNARAQSQRSEEASAGSKYGGLPIDLTSDASSSQTMTIYLEEAPTDNLALSFTVSGADGAREGLIQVNDQNVGYLFGWFANAGNAGSVSTFRYITPASAWRKGLNQVVITRSEDSNGFQILSANTWETASAVNFPNIQQTGILAEYGGGNGSAALTQSDGSATAVASNGDIQRSVTEGFITFGELMADVRESHDVPAPGVDSGSPFKEFSIPSPNSNSELLDQPLGSGYSFINGYNHIDSVGTSSNPNTMVQMGDITVALYKDGKWEEHNLGEPCRSYTYEFPDVSTGKDFDVATCRDGYAFAGIGHNGWTNPSFHSHGWIENGRILQDSGEAEYYMAWGTAKTAPVDPSQSADLNGAHYQYSIGGDKFNANDGEARTNVAHGRHKTVTDKWQVFVGTTMSADTIEDLCKSNNLPPSFPLEGRCEEGGGGARQAVASGDTSTSSSTTSSVSPNFNKNAGPAASDDPILQQGLISWREVVNQSTKPHEVVPTPAIVSTYCGSHYGAPVAKSVTRKPGQPNCNRHQLDDANSLQGFTEFNIWNHVARVYTGKYSQPNGQHVEMGRVRLAVLTKGGKWISQQFKPTCLGRLYEPVPLGIDSGNNGGNPVVQPCGDTATLGYGLGKWDRKETKYQYHGWPGQRLNVKGEQVVAVAGWFPAKLVGNALEDNDQYLLNVGMDKKGGKAAGKTERFSGAFSSRYIKLPKGGKTGAIFGSTLSGASWKRLCEQGNLPEGFPFEKGCNVPAN